MRREKGSALILVIWCVVVLSITILAAARLVQQGIASQGLNGRKFAAKQIALSGVAFGMDGRIKETDPMLKQDISPVEKLEVTIASEGGRVNINRILMREDYSILKELFKAWGVSEDEAVIAVDCLRDWVDPGDLSGLHGAEKQDLIGTGYSLPENRPFLTVAEMRGVKGMDRVEEVNPDWAKSFSTLSADQLDIQEVNAELLMVFGKMAQSQADNFVTYRNGQDQEPKTEDDIKIRNVEQVAAIVGLSGNQLDNLKRNFQVGGSPFRIISRGEVDQVAYTVEAVVAERNLKAPLLWWEER